MDPLKKELIDLGRTILDERRDPDSGAALLERYAGVFRRWYDSEGPGNPEAVLSAEGLTEIQTLHDQVLEYAVKLRDATEVSLKGMKQRGKTILAYVDTLPKRVSINKPQKG